MVCANVVGSGFFMEWELEREIGCTDAGLWLEGSVLKRLLHVTVDWFWKEDSDPHMTPD